MTPKYKIGDEVYLLINSHLRKGNIEAIHIDEYKILYDIRVNGMLITKQAEYCFNQDVIDLFEFIIKEYFDKYPEMRFYGYTVKYNHSDNFIINDIKFKLLAMIEKIKNVFIKRPKNGTN